MGVGVTGSVRVCGGGLAAASRAGDCLPPCTAACWLLLRANDTDSERQECIICAYVYTRIHVHVALLTWCVLKAFLSALQSSVTY